MTQCRARCLLMALVASVATVSAASPDAAARAPEPLPNGASQAQDAARAATQHVIDTDAKIRVAAAQVRRSQLAALEIRQHLLEQSSAQRVAERDAAEATARAGRTRHARDLAHRDFVAIVTADYQSGSGEVTMLGDLLAAKDPADVLESAQRTTMLATHHGLVVDRASAAQVLDARAQSERVEAMARVSTVTQSLQVKARAASDAVRRTQRMLRSLKVELGAARASQSQSDAVLSSFLGGWTLADPRAARELNQRFLKRAEGRPKAALPRGSGWSPAKGWAAAWRALAWIGTPYAWAGGNASGPTTGVCAGGGAHSDCHVTGFDCSGLVLNAWSPYLSLPHLASTQYFLAGRVHPEIDDLRAGDLVFWSSDATAAGIHHVALYVGRGYVVQAPQSGDIVRVTPLVGVDSGYYGATRPQT